MARWRVHTTRLRHRSKNYFHQGWMPFDFILAFYPRSRAGLREQRKIYSRCIESRYIRHAALLIPVLALLLLREQRNLLLFNGSNSVVERTLIFLSLSLSLSSMEIHPYRVIWRKSRCVIALVKSGWIMGKNEVKKNSWRVYSSEIINIS